MGEEDTNLHGIGGSVTELERYREKFEALGLRLSEHGVRMGGPTRMAGGPVRKSPRRATVVRWRLVYIEGYRMGNEIHRCGTRCYTSAS